MTRIVTVSFIALAIFAFFAPITTAAASGPPAPEQSTAYAMPAPEAGSATPAPVPATASLAATADTPRCPEGHRNTAIFWWNGTFADISEVKRVDLSVVEQRGIPVFDMPFRTWGPRNYGAKSDAWFQRTLREQARVVERWLTRNPCGESVLGGYSQGAIFAFGVAARLQRYAGRVRIVGFAPACDTVAALPLATKMEERCEQTLGALRSSAGGRFILDRSSAHWGARRSDNVVYRVELPLGEEIRHRDVKRHLQWVGLAGTVLLEALGEAAPVPRDEARSIESTRPQAERALARVPPAAAGRGGS